MGKPSAVSIDTCAWHAAMPLSQLQGKNSFYCTVVWLGVERGASWGGALFRPKCSDYQLPCLAQRSIRCLLPCGDVPERIRGQAPDAGSWFCPARPLLESGACRKTGRPEWPMISAGHAAVGAITLCGVLVPLPMLPSAGCGSSATGGKRMGRCSRSGCPASGSACQDGSIRADWLANHKCKRPATLSLTNHKVSSDSGGPFKNRVPQHADQCQAFGALGLLSLNASISAQIPRIEPVPIRKSLA